MKTPLRGEAVGRQIRQRKRRRLAVVPANGVPVAREPQEHVTPGVTPSRLLGPCTRAVAPQPAPCTARWDQWP